MINLYEVVPQERELNSEILEKIISVIHSKGFILGKEVQEFECQWAKYCGYEYAVSMGSGTVALEAIIRSHNIAQGGKIIVPVNTYSATAMAVINAGYNPAFVDCNEQFGINIRTMEHTIETQRVCGIIPVHLYGIPENIKEINKIAMEHNITVIEDAAQAHGAHIHTCNDRMYSFYPNKNLGCYGDGGIVVTQDKNRAAWIEKWRNQGRATGNTTDHRIVGTNSRLDSIQASVLISKLKYLEKWNQRRTECAEIYFNELSLCDEIILPPNKSVYSLFVIRILNGKRDEVMTGLKAKGIGCSVHYPVPLHLQGAYGELGYKQGDFPVAEMMSKEILSLPMHPYLSDIQIKFVCNTIKEVLRK